MGLFVLLGFDVFCLFICCHMPFFVALCRLQTYKLTQRTTYETKYTKQRNTPQHRHTSTHMITNNPQKYLKRTFFFLGFHNISFLFVALCLALFRSFVYVVVWVLCRCVVCVVGGRGFGVCKHNNKERHMKQTTKHIDTNDTQRQNL